MEYLIYVLILMLLMASAEVAIEVVYNKYSSIHVSTDKTGRDIVEKMREDFNLYEVRVETIGGHLTDHYDPRNKTIRLSSENAHNSTIASIAVAAHEMGHAVQDKKGYFLFTLRQHIGKLTIIANQFSWVMLFLGFLLFSKPLIYTGVGLFAILVLFDLVTLPVEINASRRAKKYLESTGYFTDDEIRGVRKVLTAAAYTYLASTLSGILQLVRLIMIARDDS